MRSKTSRLACRTKMASSWRTIVQPREPCLNRTEPKPQMRTSFTPEQLADPQTRASKEIIETCVHYGFCTNTCPTYVLTRDENESPAAAST